MPSLEDIEELRKSAVRLSQLFQEMADTLRPTEMPESTAQVAYKLGDEFRSFAACLEQVY